MKTQHNSSKFLVLLLTLISSSTLAMSKGPVKETPAPSPTPTPSPSPTPPREPASIGESITPEGFDPFNEVATPVGGIVDTTYKSYRELIPVRNAQESYRSDNCDVNLLAKDRFADRIAYAVELKMQPARAQLGYVASYFGLNKDVNTYLPNSLISHPLCTVSASALNTTFGGKNIPSAAVIAKANEFAVKMNEYRRQALAGNRDSYTKASRLWSKFLMCLSYTESLTTADTTKSQSVGQKYAPSGYRKPAGVKFYEDPGQPIESRLNIGLFQFTPDAGGNIQACIREWNQIYPSCTVSTSASQSELIKVIGSSLQTFNAFCAASKVTGMFGVQVNSTKAYNTHPFNVKPDGSLKPSTERCVSPHINVGRSYNHFGPFQNSTGDNLGTLMNCVFQGEI